MKTIAIANQKGGVGKSSITKHLAEAIALKNKKILLVDLDMQGNLTMSLNVRSSELQEQDSAIQQEHNWQYTDVCLYNMFKTGNIEVVKINDNIDLMPNEVGFAGMEGEIIARHARERILQRLLKQVEDKYDICLIDCPPAMGVIAINAFVASDYVLIPANPTEFAIKGFEQIQINVNTSNYHFDKQTEIIGILFNLVDSRTNSIDFAIKKITEEFPTVHIFETKFKKLVEMEKAEKEHRSVTGLLKDAFVNLEKELFKIIQY